MSRLQVQPMEFRFRRSMVVMGQLAKETSRTPPAEDNPPFEFIDRSLAVLGRKFDTIDQKIQQEFTGQRMYIASEFRRADARLTELKNTNDARLDQIDRRFDNTDKNVNERFDEVHQKFDSKFEMLEEKLDIRFRAVEVQFENQKAMAKNKRVNRMHQPIVPIKMLKKAAGSNVASWHSHPKVPKNMKALHQLGMRADGHFEDGYHASHYDRLDDIREARATIEQLSDFYDVQLYSDERSETDATEVVVMDGFIDEHMELLLTEWGIDWQKLVKYAAQTKKPVPQLAGIRRQGSITSESEAEQRRVSAEPKR